MIEDKTRRVCVAPVPATSVMGADMIHRQIPAGVCGKPAVLTVRASVPGGAISGGACGMGHLAVVQALVNAEAERRNAGVARPDALPRIEHGPRGLRGPEAVAKR
jgi:hypothetical protein